MFKGNFPAAALAALVFVSFALFADAVLAADATYSSSGSGLQWETALKLVSQSLAGPVAYAIALASVVGAIARLIQTGGEISDTFRVVLFLIMGLCVLMFANRFLTASMFSGATIPDNIVITVEQERGRE